MWVILSSTCQFHLGVIRVFFPNWAVTRKPLIVEWTDDNFGIGCKCTHMGPFDLEHAKVNFWIIFVHFSQNWAASRKRLIIHETDEYLGLWGTHTVHSEIAQNKAKWTTIWVSGGVCSIHRGIVDLENTKIILGSFGVTLSKLCLKWQMPHHRAKRTNIWASMLYVCISIHLTSNIVQGNWGHFGELFSQVKNNSSQSRAKRDEIWLKGHVVYALVFLTLKMSKCFWGYSVHFPLSWAITGNQLIIEQRGWQLGLNGLCI